MRFHVLWPIFGFATLFTSIHAHGDEGDVINFSASASTMRDSNLFRLASNVSPESVGLSSRADTITTTGVGVNFSKRFSLQQVVANINLTDTRYQTYDYLDFKALNYDAKWIWGVGKRLSGDASFDRSQALNTFTDYTNYRQRNVRVTQNQRFNLDYWFHANWHVVGGVSHTTLENEKEFLAESDYEANGYNLGLRYRPRSGNTLTWRMKRYDGEYSNRDFNTSGQFDNAFTQSGQEFNVNWQLSGKSALIGRLEYLSREHAHFGARDYSGWAGNLDYIYAVTGKTTYSLGYKRSLEAFQQSTSSYYVADELNLVSRWAGTGKVTTTSRMSYAKRKYLGAIIALPPGFEQRQDKTARVGFDVAYQAARWIDLRAGATVEKRFSNFSSLDYVDRILFLSADARF